MASQQSEDNVYWARPDRDRVPARTGVLMWDHSAGDLGIGRANLLASIGVGVAAVRHFVGAEGPAVLPREVPIEGFISILDALSQEFDRVVLWGHGRGAEAALVVAAHDERVDAVVALAPTDVVWQGDGEPGLAPVSSWTYADQPLAFVPWTSAGEGSCQERERARSALSTDRLAQVAIAVERIRGEVVCVAGGADPIWPSAIAANSIEARRTRHGLATRVVFDSLAGHQVVFPAEFDQVAHDTSGLDPAAQQLGRLARPAVRRVLGVSELT